MLPKKFIQDALVPEITIPKMPANIDSIRHY